MAAAAASSFWSGIFGGCSERPGEDDWTCAFAAGTKSFTRNADLLRSLVASQGDHPCQAEHDPDGLRAARWRAERRASERDQKKAPARVRGPARARWAYGRRGKAASTPPALGL